MSFSKNRLSITSAYSPRDDAYELSVLRTYESGNALYDIVMFEDGTFYYKKNTRRNDNPSSADLKVYQYIYDQHLPDPPGMWSQNIPKVVRPQAAGKTTYVTYAIGSNPGSKGRGQGESPSTLGGIR